MTTIRQAQRAIDKAGIPLEIVRGAAALVDELKSLS